MIIDVFDLLKGIIEVIPFEFDLTAKVVERGDFKLVLKSPMNLSGNIYYDGEMINVKGHVLATVEAQCSRCLRYFDYNISVDFDENYSKYDADDEVYPIVDNSINLKDMIIDSIILSMPFKILCSNECRGLCPECGYNLNEGNCNCSKDKIDPRFAILKDLFKDD
jgi:uncharacterized protein